MLVQFSEGSHQRLTLKYFCETFKKKKFFNWTVHFITVFSQRFLLCNFTKQQKLMIIMSPLFNSPCELTFFSYRLILRQKRFYTTSSFLILILFLFYLITHEDMGTLLERVMLSNHKAETIEKLAFF